ncbi:MAG: hypothetical protein RLY16_559 [Bacteroidota bacterium]
MSLKKRLLFVDRDGVLIKEAPPTYQIDDFAKLQFFPGVFTWLGKIATELDYTLIMVSNQDGLGTDSFPEAQFWPIQNFIVDSLAAEGIRFENIHIDPSFDHEQKPTRKPGTGMLTQYFDTEQYDLAQSVVIGDRVTDMQLAANLGCKAIWLNAEPTLAKGFDQLPTSTQQVILLQTNQWEDVYDYLKLPPRKVVHSRKTNETDIQIELNLDGTGIANIQTGLAFFDHMLDQLSRHGGIDLTLTCKGDLHIDEHHSIEDTAIALGEAFELALKNKRGMERYGFLLPMDDCLAQVAIDFGGRSWLVWDANFKREKIGEMPTEMFLHFFKSFSDAAKCNLNISASGENEHHKIESIFKAFAKAIKMAIKRDRNNNALPSTKGVL